jgi:predicted aminopeptidase
MKLAHRFLPARLAVVFCVPLLLAACSPLYVARAGVEEARILRRSRPIAEVARDRDTPAAVRGKLDLVVQARDFARRVLHLDAGDSYTTYSYVDSDTLLLVVSASRKDRFQPYTWWFPIVGSVPYKGFFDFDAALAEADRLDARGFDTYVRPSPAFSTLGFFNDPLLNTALRTTDVGIVSTVIHELLHNTLFIPSQVAFNESFASFVGDRGAIDFFCTRDGETSASCVEADEEWQDNVTFGGFLTELVDALDAIYGRADLDTDTKVRMREDVVAKEKQRFESRVEPRLHRSYRGFTRRPINNATLIGIRLYYRRLDLFEAIYQSSGRDLVRAIDRIRRATRDAADPFTAIEPLATSIAGPPD